MPKARVSKPLVVALLAVLALAACEPKDVISARAADSTITIGLCDSQLTNVIQFSADSEVIWRATTPAEPAPITGELVYGVLPAGYEHEVGPEPLDLDGFEQLRVELLLERDGDLAARYGGFFDAAELVSGDWIDQDGRHLQGACE